MVYEIWSFCFYARATEPTLVATYGIEEWAQHHLDHYADYVSHHCGDMYDLVMVSRDVDWN